MPRFRRSNPVSREFFGGKHRFEHWYRDNTAYFITSRCTDGYPAFDLPAARAVFWDRFYHYTRLHGFEPWVTSLLNNHYHTVGYLRLGPELGPMMRKLHGSVAKLVNDLLPTRRAKFWSRDHHEDYFDGCLRDALQLDRAYRYTRDQAVRARLVTSFLQYPDTRIDLGLCEALERAGKLKVYLSSVPYARYDRNRHPYMASANPRGSPIDRTGSAT